MFVINSIIRITAAFPEINSMPLWNSDRKLCFAATTTAVGKMSVLWQCSTVESPTSKKPMLYSKYSMQGWHRCQENPICIPIYWYIYLVKSYHIHDVKIIINTKKHEHDIGAGIRTGFRNRKYEMGASLLPPCGLQPSPSLPTSQAAAMFTPNSHYTLYPLQTRQGERHQCAVINDKKVGIILKIPLGLWAEIEIHPSVKYRCW